MLKTIALALLFLVASPRPAAQDFSSEQFKSDFDYMLAALREGYAYSQKKRIAWDRTLIGLISR